MNVALSIDWDFFFEENLWWDWGHKETSFMMETIWSTRLLSNPDLLNVFLPKGHEAFWDALAKLELKPPAFYVAESHCFAFQVFAFIVENIDVLIHFDAHSDMINLGTPPPYIDCQNWLLELLRKKRKLKVIWIKPNHYKDAVPSLKQHLLPRVHCYLASQLAEAVEQHVTDKPNLTMGYIARSGAWTPPWADKDFWRFTESSGAIVMDVPDRKMNKIRDFQTPTEEQITQMKNLRRSIYQHNEKIQKGKDENASLSM